MSDSQRGGWQRVLAVVFVACALLAVLAAPTARAASQGRLAPPHSDFGVDTDGNALFDVLRVYANVNVTVGGHFYLYTYLRDAANLTAVAFAFTERDVLASSAIVLNYPGSDIYKSGVDGPYFVFMQLYDDTFALLDVGNHTTQPYASTDFDPPGATLAPPFSDTMVDRNGNGDPDTLQIRVRLDVAKAGDYNLVGGLIDDNSVYITTEQVSLPLSPGTATVDLNFPGWIVREHGGDSVFEGYRVTLEVFDDNFNSLDFMNYDTQSVYNWALFEPKPASLAPPHADVGVDLDGDGLFDRLAIDLSVDVTAPGSVMIQVDLWDVGFTTGLGFQTKTVWLAAGPHTVRVDFSTLPMIAASLAGPYFAQISLWSNEFDILDQTSYLTGAYPLPQFDPFPVALGGASSDRGVDLDVPADGLFNVLEVTVPVIVGEASGFIVEAELWDASGTIPLGSDTRYVSRATGNQTVTVRFPGPSIRRAAVNGPYLVHVTLELGADFSSVVVATQNYTTSAYASTQFQGRIPATLQGTVREAATGLSVSRPLVFAYNYADEARSVTRGNTAGSYSMNLYEGSWVLTYFAFPLRPRLEVLTVTAPATTHDTNMQPRAFNPVATDVALGSWSRADFSAQETFVGQAELAPLLVDWFAGNRDQSVTQAEWVANRAVFDYVPTPAPTSEALLLIDGLTYALAPGSDSLTYVDPTGSIFGAPPGTATESTSYEGGTAPSGTHEIRLRAQWDTTGYGLSHVYTIHLPPGFTVASYSSISGVNVSWIGGTVTVDPGLDPDETDLDDGVWVTLTAADGQPPAILSVVASPDPVEIFQPLAFAVSAIDNEFVAGASIDLVDPTGSYVGNFPMNPVDPQGNQWTLGFSPSLLGVYQYTVNVIDLAMNIGTATGQFTSVDRTPPVLSAPTATPNPQEYGQPTLLRVGVTDNVGVASVSVAVRDPANQLVGNFSATWNAATSAYEVSRTFLAIGTLSFTMWATDTSGLVSSASGTFRVQDTTPPSLQSTVSPGVFELGGAVTITAFTSDLAGVASASVQMWDPFGMFLGTFPMTFSGGEAYAVTFTPSALGAYAFTITITDGSGNTATSSGTFVGVDTTPPAVTLAASTPDPVELRRTVTISAHIADLGGVASVGLEILDTAGTVIAAPTLLSLGGGAYASVYLPTTLGLFAYRFTATDGSGNTARFTGSFTVQDTTAPTARAGPDRTILAGTTLAFDGGASGDNDAVATYTWSFLDAGTVVTLTDVAPSYRFDNPGTITVLLTVTDPSGNVGSDEVAIAVTSPAATTGDVRGLVTDLNGQPVAGATVRLLRGTTEVATATTDGNGLFSFAALPADSYAVRVSAAGLRDGAVLVEVTAGGTSSVTVALAAPASGSTPTGSGTTDLLLAAVAILGVALALLSLFLRRRPPAAEPRSARPEKTEDGGTGTDTEAGR